MDKDRLGRRRRPEQERGLRPLHPLLPERWTSRPLRVAMSEADWLKFDALAREAEKDAPTQARAFGLTISALMRQSPDPRPDPGPLDWMDWERRKTLRLLMPSAPRHS